MKGSDQRQASYARNDAAESLNFVEERRVYETMSIFKSFNSAKTP
jgi:hypothetical protein